MEKALCPFGQFFREQRKIQGLSLWSLALSIPYPQGNIQRIERGLHEPRLGLAIRMISAIGVDAGIFLRDLACQEGLLRGDSDSPQSMGTVAGLKQDQHNEQDSVRCLFGPLFRESRLAHGKSQKLVAESAAYTLRNLINVEKGSQEPGVMLALRLVASVGEDPNVFFHHLQDVMGGSFS